MHAGAAVVVVVSDSMPYETEKKPRASTHARMYAEVKLGIGPCRAGTARVHRVLGRVVSAHLIFGQAQARSKAHRVEVVPYQLKPSPK